MTSQPSRRSAPTSLPVSGTFRSLLVAATLIFLLFASSSGSHEVVVDTPIGSFFAKSYKLYSREVQAFHGIRYAASPAGKHRFKGARTLSQVNLSNSEMLDHTPSCPQIIGQTYMLELTRVDIPAQEDCLFLNIWRPIESKKFQPVVVFVHGGNFVRGSSGVESLNATIMAARIGAVVVSFQYRLGALGFLYSGDDFAPGNAGLKDQVLAFEWIRDNIRHFGGDNTDVTVIGHGSGGSSLGYHLLSPKTSTLFKRAILLSGTPNSETAFLAPRESRKRAEELFTRLVEDDTLTFDRAKDVLLTRSWGDIIAAQEEYDRNDFLRTSFLPTIDGNLVTDHPMKMLDEADHLKDKEIIIGWTRNEGINLVHMHTNSESGPVSVDKSWASGRLEMIAKRDENLTSALLNLYAKEEGNYFDIFTDAVGDFYYKCPARQFAEGLRKKGALVYLLEYVHRPSSCPSSFKVGHGCDLDTLFWRAQESATRNSADVAVRSSYYKYLSEFIHAGHRALESKNWTRNEVFVISSNSGEKPDPRTTFCRAVENAIPMYVSGTPVIFKSAAWTVILYLCSASFGY